MRGLVRRDLRTTGIGAIAQLGERLHGMQEVGGSIPPGSTIYKAGHDDWPFFSFWQDLPQDSKACIRNSLAQSDRS